VTNWCDELVSDTNSSLKRNRFASIWEFCTKSRVVRENEERIGSFRAENIDKEEPVLLHLPYMFINQGAKRNS